MPDASRESRAGCALRTGDDDVRQYPQRGFDDSADAPRGRASARLQLAGSAAAPGAVVYRGDVLFCRRTQPGRGASEFLATLGAGAETAGHWRLSGMAGREARVLRFAATRRRGPYAFVAERFAAAAGIGCGAA